MKSRTRRLRLIYLAPLLALLALGGWVFASPVGSSPDDDFHLASIWCADAGKSFACEPGDSAGERIVPEAIYEVSKCYQHLPEESAACQEAALQSDPTPSEASTRGNFLPSYPPVYYAVMSVFVGSDIQISVLVMRLFSVALFVGLTTATYLFLQRDRRSALIVPWIVTTVPLGMFLIASNNPSSWAIIGIGTLWISLLGFFEGGGKRKIGLGLIAVTSATMAAGARGDAATYVGVTLVVVAALTFTPTRRFILDAILPFVLGLIAIGFFFSSRQVRSGLGGFGGGDPIEVREKLDPVQLAISNFLELPGLYAGIFGGEYGLGWLDTILPAVVTFTGAAAFFAVAAVGIAHTGVRKGLVLAGMTLLLWLLPVYVLTSGLHPVGEQVQPRYLLPLVVLFAGILVLKVPRGEFTLSAAQRVVVVALLSFGQIVALHGNMRRYITGTDNGGLNLNNGIEWWWTLPLTPMVVLVIASAAYTALLIVLTRELGVARARRRPSIVSDAEITNPRETTDSR